ncbi:carboxypeptidase-like regulatory domain-containing protein, partial [Prolixibacteraceae bacterium]|nr:carboxypeptidase-like regulatory domain-containing protein [Prolixibacteraceae bacterium]
MMRILKNGTRKLLLTTMLVIVSTALFAQKNTLSGVVTGKDDQAPIPGATVLVKGTTNGTITTFEGTYSIDLEKGDI